MPLSSRPLRPVAGALAAASIALLAACGGESGGDPAADPAAVVPARAPVYVEANLKPADDIVELAKKLSGEDDPGAALKRAIEKQARENDRGFKFSEDIEPWLGERAGVFVPRVTAGGDETPAGIILPTKDSDKARDALEEDLRQAEEGEDKPQIVKRTHRDTEYSVDTTDDDGVAILGDYAVVGNDAAIKGAIDAREGESLAETSEYEKARGAVEADGVGFMYVRLSQIFSGLGPQGAVARQAFGGLGETIAIGLDGDASTINLESAALGVSGEAGATDAGEVFGELPADSWLAAGVSDLGARIERGIQQITQAGQLAGQDPEQLLDQLEAQLGIDPRRDLAAWMGDVGFFVFGDTPAEVGGGLVATTKDAGATRRAIPRIARFLGNVAQVSARPLRRGGIDTGVTLRAAQMPLPIHMALTDDDRFVVAVTDPALEQVLRTGATLGDSRAFKDAAGKLGEGMEPSVFMDFDPLAGLVDATGTANDPNVAQARKALDRLTTLVAGAKREGETSRGRVVVGVK